MADAFLRAAALLAQALLLQVACAAAHVAHPANLSVRRFGAVGGAAVASGDGAAGISCVDDGLDLPCARAALFISPTMLAIKHRSHWTRKVEAAYRQTIARLSPGASAALKGLESEDSAQAVHTVVLFRGPIANGMAAARDLQRKLLADDVGRHFDKKIFGEVHMESVTEPFLVSCAGAWQGLTACMQARALGLCCRGTRLRLPPLLLPPACLRSHLPLPLPLRPRAPPPFCPQANGNGEPLAGAPNTVPTGMISVAFFDLKPAKVTQALKDKYVAAIRAALPGGWCRGGGGLLAGRLAWFMGEGSTLLWACRRHMHCRLCCR